MSPSDAPERYTVNGPGVIYELFEREIVIVNLDTGHYFAVQDAGVDMWNALTAGATVAEATELLADRFEAEPSTIADSISSLLDELRSQGLLVARPASAPPFDRQAVELPASGRRPFQAPTLQTYTDMQDLLLLDPIHEVDASGWPVPAPKGSDSET